MAEWFPIMGARAIPWAVIAPFEARARRNHGGQSLETLASRGGLDAAEAVAVLENRHWARMDRAAAEARLRELVERADGLATIELEAAKDALGRGWLAGGATLAEGIARKTTALELLARSRVEEDERHG